MCILKIYVLKELKLSPRKYHRKKGKEKEKTPQQHNDGSALRGGDPKFSLKLRERAIII